MEQTKWLARNKHGDLGKVFDTKEEALEYSKMLIKRSDEMTGFEKVFGHPSEEPFAEELITREVSTEEYKGVLKTLDELKERYHQLMLQEAERYLQVARAYENQVPYDVYDEIEMQVRLKNGHKKTYKAVVCDVCIFDNGERRPQLRGQSYPSDAEILSIKVLRKESQVTLIWGGVSKAREL